MDSQTLLCTSLIPALDNQRQMNLCEFRVSLFYIMRCYVKEGEKE